MLFHNSVVSLFLAYVLKVYSLNVSDNNVLLLVVFSVISYVSVNYYFNILWPRRIH